MAKGMVDKNNSPKEPVIDALRQAWINTRMEQDKSLLIISMGVIGFLISLITFSGRLSMLGLILFSIALFLFLVTVIAVIRIFRKNADYIQSYIGLLLKKAPTNNERELFKKNKRNLKILDHVVCYCFHAGIVVIMVIGASTMIDKYQLTKENNMNEKETERQDSESVEGTVKIQRSLVDIDTILPDEQVDQDSSDTEGDSTEKE